MGGTYSFVRTASANLRETNDTYNTALGGFFAGSILGLRGVYFVISFQWISLADIYNSTKLPRGIRIRNRSGSDLGWF